MAEIKIEAACQGILTNSVGAVSVMDGTAIKKFKGVKISCGDLRKYLYAVEIYRRASMLRKGREVHKIYINVHKGVSFLDDRFTLTEFGKMVLENGSVRAGRARNVRQIVVARETLYCSGTGGCKRACGGYGSCTSGCDKVKVRGHKCSFRVKLTMRLGFVDHWFVEILGSHNWYVEPQTDMDKMLADYETKSSDEEDSNVSSSPQASISPSMIINHNGMPPTNLTHSSLLISPAHYPLNVPLFPESYLMTLARNAAVPNGTCHSSGQPSHLSLSMKPDTSKDLIVPEVINSLLQSSTIPQYGLIQTSVSMSLDNNGSASNASLVDAIDLSTPRTKKEDNCEDLSINNSKQERAAYKHCLYIGQGLTPKNKISTSDNDGLSSSYTNSITTDNIKDSLLPGSPKSVFNSTPSSQRFSVSPLIKSSPSSPSLSTNHRYLKCAFKNDQPFQIANENSALSNNGPFWAHFIEGGEECKKTNCDKPNVGHLDKDLINRVQQLEAHVTQLRNIVLKQDGTHVILGQGNKKQRDFDFTKYNTRHVALKIVYLGWDYNGFVVQEDSDKTIESVIFEALLKTRLIESRDTCNYHRCGRTDKGVSALGQAISIDLRTNLLAGVGVKIRESGTAALRSGDKTTEIRYVHILNKVLPPEIRVLAWAPVDVEFSARFSCKKRTYKYYFPKGNLDIQKMNDAASNLIGEHDFRNLCKMDVGNGVVNFTRKILRADITVLQEVDNGYSMCELTVVGQAFLWHQIRCIVSVLFLIAQGKEDITIIEELLNVEKNPRKPQYTMASELPLVLFDCEFGDDLEWIYEADWHEDNIRQLQQMWAQYSVKATMIKRMLEELDIAKVETESDIAPWNELSAPFLQQSEWLIPGNKPRVYKPLFKRQMCESLEERLQYYSKRKKLTSKEMTESTSETS